jgi:hypothetical protein
MRTRLGWVSIFLLSACGSTAPVDVSSDVGENAATLSAGADGWYLVHADLRKCASPMCGGYFVSRANLARTVCIDGHARAECYVAALDWSATKFSVDEQAKLDGAAVVMHGRLVATDYAAGRFARLAISDVWSPAVTPERNLSGYPIIDGTLYRAFDNGTRCITWPCPSTTELRLNTSERRNIAGVDLSDSCANDKQVAEAYDAMATPTGILVDGFEGWTNGPGGWMRELVGWNFYLRVEPAPVASSQ